MALLSMRQYATHRGVTVGAVSKAVKTGRITCRRDENGYALIDPEVADREWGANSDPTKFRFSVSEPADPEISDEAKKKAGVRDAQTVLKTYQARLAKLEFDEKMGKYHEVETCKKERFRVARAVRDTLLGIPDRLSAELAGETDQFAVRKLLEDEIRKALENLANDIEAGNEAV